MIGLGSPGMGRLKVRYCPGLKGGNGLPSWRQVERADVARLGDLLLDLELAPVLPAQLLLALLRVAPPLQRLELRVELLLLAAGQHFGGRHQRGVAEEQLQAPQREPEQQDRAG